MICNVSYEELATWSAGDMAPGRQADIQHHITDCPQCQRRLASLGQADSAMVDLMRARPPAEAVLAARQAAARELQQAAQPPEIMTLAETAAFLRLSEEQLGDLADELPAFELAGQVRVRRQRLIEWIQQREQDYTRQTAASRVACAIRVIGKGVA